MRYSAVLASVALATALAGCGSSSDNASSDQNTAKSTTTASAATTSGVITIKDFKYSGELSVKAGAKVTVKNEDTAAHTLTDKGKAFDTGNIAGGATGTFTAPMKAGSYSVICTYHPNMKATLVVT